ncbi:MAG TPA: MBL fold metallo-hydrolase [Rhizomicrobium sp.]|nr:MBL fold metallo-hydrolase [Rhizomicrobium sp.]
MKRHFGTALLMAMGLMSANAAPVPDSIDAHVLAAQKAAGLDFAGTLEVLCIQPADGSDPSAVARTANAGKPRAIPPRESWYAEPAKVFDNVYFVGTKIHNAWAIKTSAGIILLDTMFNYAAESEIVDGLKKLGLDPATIKYVIVSHGHGDHDEGAKMLQDKYGARIIMGAPDWDAITKAGNMPGGVPKRDMVATDGQKVTLGDETVTILLTPGHTLGTLSFLFPVKDYGKTLQVAYSGGMGFNFPRSPERFDTYIASAKKFGDAAKAAGASIIFSNHSMYDQAWIRSRWVRKPGQVSPFVVGADGIARYVTVLSECAKAAKLRLKGA